MPFECNFSNYLEHSQQYLCQCFHQKFTHTVDLCILGNVRKLSITSSLHYVGCMELLNAYTSYESIDTNTPAYSRISLILHSNCMKHYFDLLIFTTHKPVNLPTTAPQLVHQRPWLVVAPL